ncbi:MAG: MgtC/SapB family protein [Opitutae bacterium]|nr:MgtC/SapB family protein [Opitutae bacterium]
MLTEFEMVVRLALSALFGGLVGLERERHSQPAGLRTHTILAIGATLAMIVSLQIAAQSRTGGFLGDPARLAAQVVSGVGFLGAGAIIRFGSNIKGLTTATSLWTVAIIGLAVGAGYFFAATFTAAVLMFTLTIMDKWEKRVIVHTSTHTITIRAEDGPGVVDCVHQQLTALDVEVKSQSFTKNIQSNEIVLKVVVKIRDKANEHELITRLSTVPGCKDIGME